MGVAGNSPAVTSSGCGALPGSNSSATARGGSILARGAPSPECGSALRVLKRGAAAWSTSRILCSEELGRRPPSSRNRSFAEQLAELSECAKSKRSELDVARARQARAWAARHVQAWLCSLRTSCRAAAASGAIECEWLSGQLWGCGRDAAAELLRQFSAGLAGLDFQEVKWWHGATAGWRTKPGNCSAAPPSGPLLLGNRQPPMDTRAFGAWGFAARVRVSWGSGLPVGGGGGGEPATGAARPLRHKDLRRSASEPQFHRKDKDAAASFVEELAKHAKWVDGVGDGVGSIALLPMQLRGGTIEHERALQMLRTPIRGTPNMEPRKHGGTSVRSGVAESTRSPLLSACVGARPIAEAILGGHLSTGSPDNFLVRAKEDSRGRHSVVPGRQTLANIARVDALQPHNTDVAALQKSGRAISTPTPEPAVLWAAADVAEAPIAPMAEETGSGSMDAMLPEGTKPRMRGQAEQLAPSLGRAPEAGTAAYPSNTDSHGEVGASKPTGEIQLEAESEGNSSTGSSEEEVPVERAGGAPRTLCMEEYGSEFEDSAAATPVSRCLSPGRRVSAGERGLQGARVEEHEAEGTDAGSQEVRDLVGPDSEDADPAVDEADDAGENTGEETAPAPSDGSASEAGWAASPEAHRSTTLAGAIASIGEESSPAPLCGLVGQPAKPSAPLLEDRTYSSFADSADFESPACRSRGQ